VVPFLVILGGQVIRVAATAAARRLAQLGAQRISAEAAKKAGGRVLTARTAGDASKLFAKYGKDIAKYRPARNLKPTTKVVKPTPSGASAKRMPKPKPDAKPADKPKSNVTPTRKPVRGSRIDVKPNAKKLKPDTKVAGTGRGGSRTTGAPSKLPTAAGAAGKRMPRLTRNQKLALGIGVGGAATAVVDKIVGDSKKKPTRPTSGPTTRGSRRPKSADKPRSTSGPSTRGSRRPPSADKPRSTSGPSTRGSRRPPSADKLRPTSGPSTRGSRKPKSVRELEAMKKPRVSGPTTRGSAKRGATARITAGPNVGFGPKGNIFPKDAADRRRLMAKYGGTGSAAAKAAAAGKQGNMKKGSK